MVGSCKQFGPRSIERRVNHWKNATRTGQHSLGIKAGCAQLTMLGSFSTFLNHIRGRLFYLRSFDPAICAVEEGVV